MEEVKTTPTGKPGALKPEHNTFFDKKEAQNRMGLIDTGGAYGRQIEFKREGENLHVAPYDPASKVALQKGVPVKLIFSISKDEKLVLTGVPSSSSHDGWHKIEVN